MNIYEEIEKCVIGHFSPNVMILVEQAKRVVWFFSAPVLRPLGNVTAMKRGGGNVPCSTSRTGPGLQPMTWDTQRPKGEENDREPEPRRTRSRVPNDSVAAE